MDLANQQSSDFEKAGLIFVSLESVLLGDRNKLRS